MPPQIILVFVAALTSILIMIIYLVMVGEQGENLSDENIYEVMMYLPFTITIVVYQSLFLLVINAYLTAFRKLAQNVEGKGSTLTDLDEFETLIDAYQSLNFGIGKENFP